MRAWKIKKEIIILLQEQISPSSKEHTIGLTEIISWKGLFVDEVIMKCIFQDGNWSRTRIKLSSSVHLLFWFTEASKNDNRFES